ncbi:MAG TPA: hypothetical protein VJ385_20245 [Fibrobacteria bacterium]|nr:hypothetical protein [Fibrobacteria bacterium]
MEKTRNGFRYEHFSQPLVPTGMFLRRLAGHGGVALAFLAFSLLGGMAGYHLAAGLPWVDSFLNASMILAGMGPIDPLPSDLAKWFAGFYALYSGIAFLTCIGLFFAPVFHRLLHKFHLNR